MKASKNATVAKARAVYGKRLKESDYAELMSKKKVSEAAEYLKRNTHYSEALANVDTSAVHRGFLESLLNKAYYDQYEKLCKFQHLNDEPFYNFLLVRFEIRELLKAILYLNNERDDVYIESMHAYLMKRTSFDLIELAKAKDFKKLLEVIKHTPYYNIIKNIKADKNGNIPYTKCEVMLRTYYLKWLIETAEKAFDGKSKIALLEQIYAQTDIINIINSYRMKKYFYADADILKENMLPFYGKLSREKQNELFETGSPEDFLRTLSKNLYGRRMEGISENMESEAFERELVKLRCGMARRALTFSDSAAVSLYSLMYLSEVELQNIIKIVESIRYGKSASYMEKQIIIH